jgi:hypothetical protein
MVAKFLLLQFVLFAQGFVKLARNDFHRNFITAQPFRWLSSPWAKSPKFRLKVILQPSQFKLCRQVFF